MFESLRKRALEIPVLRRPWARYRAGQALRRYQAWARKYGRIADERRLVYTKETAARDIRNHMRHKSIVPKRTGQLNSVIFIIKADWGAGVVNELAKLGDVNVFDYKERGFTMPYRKLQGHLQELNRQMLDFVMKAHERKPVDWILFTHTGGYIFVDTIRRIREQLGIPIVNQWFDCKQNFEGGAGVNGQDIGQSDIAPEFDAVWTSSRSVCEWYMAIGARPIFLPPGFSPAYTPRADCEKKSDIGFFGQCYGTRPDYITTLKRAGLSVSVGGYGWRDFPAIAPCDISKFIASCKVNLGISGVGYSMDLVTLKGRDFEVPGSGGVYLATYNPDLEPLFDIGKEIFCYRSMAEMIDLARMLVYDEALRESAAENGYRRAIKEHRWLHRFKELLKILGLIKEDE